jgi:MoxR-like ATPase
LVEVIHPRFEALDLLYRIDSIERLADAQTKNLDPSNDKYVKAGRLWQAIERIQSGQPVPVLLIDEIDKADADIPNALLDVLGNRSFSVPLLDNRVIRAEDGRLPLVIITTNEERELPAAFVRRCAVLNLNPPEEAEFVAWLVERGRVHRHLEIDDTARQHAAVQVLADRKAARAEGYPSVGLAEYIDLLAAVHELTADTPATERANVQLEWLQKLSPYALVKNANQSQKRPAEALPADGTAA